MKNKALLTRVLNTISVIIIPFVVVFSGALNADMRLEHPEIYSAGKKTFMHYCARCHGQNADGRGRVAPMYLKLRHPKPSNFTVGIYAIRPSEYLMNIISEGGEQNKLSQYMPPFKDELTSIEIKELVYFIQQTAKHRKVLVTEK